ncbi:putative inner membrane protein [Yersinia frederiksenii]|uniref:Membrane protein n=2 Tax=Yersinia frederiksenii TaxID=29484 RepID=A0ABR4W834_YERFR|nr:hypothetical protein [Yersinia frederiksenii]ATM94735.1 DNA gyrase subunit B [Yersinia frederiksenii]EEQ13485.1 hypothetical protein yfred0001_35100 [Yersinia frederiksenii ATCC 33641]KGA48885.1 putative membrane protein [Yersinia frederiksenii ATCC 33641]MDN0120985.1 hypothetical protein [Yersinia frederiksenii]CFR13865.1 putative inner membrane protein [Yersinia frederiksenii]
MTTNQSNLFIGRLTILLKIFTVIAFIAYPLAVWFGLTYWGMQVLAPILLLMFTLRLFVVRHQIKQQLWLGKALAVTGIILSLASWGLGKAQWLLFYPVVVNILLLSLFAYSLFYPPPIIERLARLAEPELSPQAVAYTRKVTLVWCVFFAVNGTISLATCLYSNMHLWVLYNGGLSYLLIGSLMGLEWIVRKRVQQQ